MGTFVLNGFQALATTWYVELFESISPQQQEIVRIKLEKIIVSFENTYSRFKEDSLLSYLNTHRTVAYDLHLVQMLHTAQKVTDLTSGIFDIFIHDILVSKGYGTNHTPHQGVIDDGAVSSFVITNSIIKLTGKKSIDLGGIGKGYLIDMLRNYLTKQCGIQEFLINGGGDIYGTHNNGEAIELLLQHPQQREMSLGSILIKNKAFCSSSSYVRTWKHEGAQKNHFVTRDGKEIWAASFVVGESTTMADCMATVLCVTSNNKELSDELAKKSSITYRTYDKDFSCFGSLEIIT